jgi:Raf kinase inhibitor-like YbhB/YbcL family protein
MKLIPHLVCFTLLLLNLGAGATQDEAADTIQKEGEKKMVFAIASGAFEEGGLIPKQYTCDSMDISPPLTFSGIPDSARSLALICDDPDAPMGTWVHWVLYNLSPDTSGLPENVPGTDTLSSTTRQGISDFGRYGYGGPCPPGGTHRYYFKLYALDTMLDLKGKVSKSDLEKAMKGHILAEAQLMGRYSRQR